MALAMTGVSVSVRTQAAENNSTVPSGTVKVHFLDVGGIEPPEAIGIEKVIQGLRSKIQDDQQLLELSNYVFDGLYANFFRE